MEILKLITTVVLFTFISSILTEDINYASPDETNKLILTCDEDSSIQIKTFWNNSFTKNCPNRSLRDTILISMKIIMLCQMKQNCSIDLNNHTMTNCTNYKDYIDVQYTCNFSATTTDVITTTAKTVNDDSDDNDDDDDHDDDNSDERTTTTTKKPRGRVEPHYLPQPVPNLLTTLRPTQRPAHFPQPLLPVPAPKIPTFPVYIRPKAPLFQNFKLNPPPIFMPMPMPMPVPIPLFG